MFIHNVPVRPGRKQARQGLGDVRGPRSCVRRRRQQRPPAAAARAGLSRRALSASCAVRQASGVRAGMPSAPRWFLVRPRSFVAQHHPSLDTQRLASAICPSLALEKWACPTSCFRVGHGGESALSTDPPRVLAARLPLWGWLLQHRCSSGVPCSSFAFQPCACNFVDIMQGIESGTGRGVRHAVHRHPPPPQGGPGHKQTELVGTGMCRWACVWLWAGGQSLRTLPPRQSRQHAFNPRQEERSASGRPSPPSAGGAPSRRRRRPSPPG